MVLITRDTHDMAQVVSSSIRSLVSETLFFVECVLGKPIDSLKSDFLLHTVSARRSDYAPSGRVRLTLSDL